MSDFYFTLILRVIFYSHATLTIYFKKSHFAELLTLQFVWYYWAKFNFIIFPIKLNSLAYMNLLIILIQNLSIGLVHRYQKTKNRLLKVCYVPATNARLPRLFFLFLSMQLLTVLTKQTRQAVHVIKQSMYLDVYGLAPWTYVLQLFSSEPTITNKLSRINQIHYWRSFCKRHEHYNFLQLIQIMKLETYLQKIIKRDQA